MATEAKTKTRQTKTVPEKQTPASDIEVQADNTKEDQAVQHVKPVVPKDVDQAQMITVKSGRHGRLIYKSPRTTEKFVWPEFGAEQDMELRELRNAKNTVKKYFRDNWFMFDEEFEWVIDYLGVRPFYKNALTLDSFDSLFTKPATEITRIIAGLSDGQKKSVGYRARQMIADGEIDSRRSIDALEKALGIELIER